VGTESITAAQVAARLSQFWDLHKKGRFADYLRTTFGYSVCDLPTFDCLYVARIENGDTEKGYIGGILLQWWAVDDDGLRQIPNPELPTLLNEPENLRAGFYPKPVLKFYLENDRTVIGESFGPSCNCRKTARLRIGDDNTIQFFDERIVWNANSLERTPKE
jgi:hypothetical protein